MATQEETKLAIERAIKAMQLRPSIAQYTKRSAAHVRIPTKPAMHSNLKPATCSDAKPAGIPI